MSNEYFANKFVRVQGAPGYDDFCASLWDGRVINGKMVVLDAANEAFVIEEQYIKDGWDWAREDEGADHE